MKDIYIKIKLMKKVFFACMLLCSVNLTQGQYKEEPAIILEISHMKWDQKVINLGKIKLNNPSTAIFHFTNNGTSPLIISDVKASCSCTVAEYTKDPVAPGKSGQVKAQYNASKLGSFTKTVTVFYNEEGGMETLTIEGEVVE